MKTKAKKDIVFVIAPSCFGKSTYIKKNFPEYKVIDVFDYQKDSFLTKAGLNKANYKCLIDLLDAIENNDKVVLEHVFSKKHRREPFIEAIIESFDIKPRCVFLDISKTQYEKNLKAKNISGYSYNFIKSVFEKPSIDEGFSNVKIVKRFSTKQKEPK